RKETEWTETIESGYNVLCPGAEKIEMIIENNKKKVYKNYYGYGNASNIIINKIKEHL
ncbi:MAG: UDP-N-acetylglucosamine 2-epimerase (non-hydrolyzing), partial [bacterium (Candidatus Stahlbacteria) CG23_combo_of_CG06-09_8_20_14_all_34_7]